MDNAYAQVAGGAGNGFDPMTFLPLVLIFVVFYLLLIRPQQKQMKQRKAMLEALSRGDKVVTGGGIIGTITKVGPEEHLTVEIAPGVEIQALRSTVSSVVAKPGADVAPKAAVAPAPKKESAKKPTAAKRTQSNTPKKK